MNLYYDNFPTNQTNPRPILDDDTTTLHQQGFHELDKAKATTCRKAKARTAKVRVKAKAKKAPTAAAAAATRHGVAGMVGNGEHCHARVM